MGVLRKIGFRLGLAVPDCEDVRASASDLLDEEMAPRRRRLVERHLERCGPCRSFVDTLRRTVSALRRLPRRRAPDAFKESLRERLR